jgi:hypothetical protein
MKRGMCMARDCSPFCSKPLTRIARPAPTLATTSTTSTTPATPRTGITTRVLTKAFWHHRFLLSPSRVLRRAAARQIAEEAAPSDRRHTAGGARCPRDHRRWSLTAEGATVLLTVPQKRRGPLRGRERQRAASRARIYRMRIGVRPRALGRLPECLPRRDDGLALTYIQGVCDDDGCLAAADSPSAASSGAGSAASRACGRRPYATAAGW